MNIVDWARTTLAQPGHVDVGRNAELEQRANSEFQMNLVS